MLSQSVSVTVGRTVFYRKKWQRFTATGTPMNVHELKQMLGGETTSPDRQVPKNTSAPRYVHGPQTLCSDPRCCPTHMGTVTLETRLVTIPTSPPKRRQAARNSHTSPTHPPPPIKIGNPRKSGVPARPGRSSSCKSWQSRGQ